MIQKGCGEADFDCNTLKAVIEHHDATMLWICGFELAAGPSIIVLLEFY